MKLRILMIIFALTSLASCGGGGGYIRAVPGVQKSDVRDIKPFHKLSISVPAQVYIEVGSKESFVLLLGDEVAIGAVSTEVKDGTLIIDVKKNLNLNTNVPLQITVHSPNLDALNVSGAVKVIVPGLKGDSFDMSATGACKAEAGGDVTKLTINSSGACNLDFGKVESKFVKLVSSGASNTKLDATESLDIDVSGASKVRYRGNPKKLEKKVSGVSSIEEYTSN